MLVLTVMQRSAGTTTKPFKQSNDMIITIPLKVNTEISNQTVGWVKTTRIQSDKLAAYHSYIVIGKL